MKEMEEEEMEKKVQEMLNGEMDINWKPSPFEDKELEKHLDEAYERWHMTVEELREAANSSIIDDEEMGC